MIRFAMQLALTTFPVLPGCSRHEQLCPGAVPSGHFPCDGTLYHSPPKYVAKFGLLGSKAWCMAGSLPTVLFMSSGQYCMSGHDVEWLDGTQGVGGCPSVREVGALGG